MLQAIAKVGHDLSSQRVGHSQHFTALRTVMRHAHSDEIREPGWAAEIAGPVGRVGLWPAPWPRPSPLTLGDAARWGELRSDPPECSRAQRGTDTSSVRFC